MRRKHRLRRNRSTTAYAACRAQLGAHKDAGRVASRATANVANIANAPLRSLFLTVFAIAFGVEEAIVVVYLRLIPAQHGQITPDTYHIEIGRELCTIVVLVCVA